MALVLSGQFQPIAVNLQQVLNFGNNVAGINPFYEVMGDNTVFPYSIRAVAMDQLQFILNLDNTTLEITTTEDVKIRGETMFFTRMFLDRMGGADKELFSFPGVEYTDGEFQNIYGFQSYDLVHNSTPQTQPAPEFLIKIKVRATATEGMGLQAGENNGQEENAEVPWTTGELSQIILHELHFHAMDCANVIAAFQASNQPLDNFVHSTLPEPSNQHGALVGSVDEAVNQNLLINYKRSRAQLYVNTIDQRPEIWNDFSSIEWSDCKNNNIIGSDGGFSVDMNNSWWGNGQIHRTPNPPPEETAEFIPTPTE